MMLPTHAVVGLAIATPVVAISPDLAGAALSGGLLGGIIPDLDMYFGHRKTLHYPTGYSLLSLPAVGGAALWPTQVSVGLAFVLLAAAVHCQMDRYGGGLELKPWEGTSDRAVYDHVRGEWREPKRWIPYDGSPQDLLLLLAVAAPLLVVLDDPFRLIVAAAVVISTIYVALRRWLAALAPTVFGYVPEWLASYVPERYR